MYQALYRKYRPQTLNDVCGQSTIVRIIKNSIQNNQINHAYLFAGPRGTGKTSIAKIFAKIVNCENPINCEPCNKCVSCTQTNNSDIIEIDAASNNGVDEIRELRNKVNLVPAYGKYKVYIIDEVHMLTTGAFNALLKTLEEPPSHIIFILATTDPHKIPETILSRCQRLDFKRISQKEIVDNLKKIAQKENINIEEKALNEIARLSDGGMRDSVGMLDQARAYSEDQITAQDIYDINGTVTQEDLAEICQNIDTKNIENILTKLDNYAEKGKNFAKLTEELIELYRNILLAKQAPKYFQNNHENQEIYLNLAKNNSVTKIIKNIEILNEYLLEMKETNNLKLLLELALIKIISNEESQENPKNVENSLKNVEKEVKITEKKSKTEQNFEQKVENLEPKESKKVEKELKKENEVLKKQIMQIQKIRIDNTLANFNKQILNQIKSQLDTLNDLLLDSDYSQFASLILDGTLKAASTDNLIFVYPTERLATSFNENLLSLEKTIAKALNKEYKIIATDNENWQKIKEEFNSKSRKFIYTEENFNLKEIFKNDNNDILNLFEDIIEYN